MTTTAPSFDALVRAARDRSGLLRLLEALGFAVTRDVVPRSAWPAWGLGRPLELAALVVAGRAGSMDALVLELRAGAALDDAPRLAAAIRGRNAARLHFFAVAAPGYEALLLGTYGAGESFRHVVIERDGLRASDLELLEELAARPGEEGLALALRHGRALDRSRLTRRFFLEFRERRAAVAAAWTGVPAGAGPERAQLALLLLSRLTFLYFIQRRGALAGDERYVPRLLGEWLRGPRGGTTFYRTRLVPLFFAALNRRPEERDGDGRALGELPYLNGGLFERHPLERRFPDLDLRDSETRGVIEGLLERYRFTTREEGEGAGFGVDPEMLGRVFEGLMAPGDRGDTGSFYTPAPVVNRVVREAVSEYLAGACGREDASAVLDGSAATLSVAGRRRVRKALDRVRVLDPACGSGAFLLGALWRLADALGAVGEQPPDACRRAIVGRSLHGVDLLDDAALLCSLRLWLALSAGDGEVRPLPNLDRRIRQGDALVDPLDLAAGTGAAPAGEAFHPLRDADVRRALRAVEPAARRYLDSGPGDRQRLRERLAEAERTLARRWVDGVARFEDRRLLRLRTAAADRDLFGDVAPDARRALLALPAAEARAREVRRLRDRIEDDGTLPFFSFGIHFSDAAAGFDLILSNPPWVRSHRWPERLRAVARRYEVCREAGWRGGAALAGAPAGVGAQVDLSLLFLERAVRLLAPGGVLALLLPAKTFRALYGGGARRICLRDLEITSIEDHALDHRSIFRADAFAGVLVARKRAGRDDSARNAAGPANGGPVRVELVRRGGEPLRFSLRERDLSLFPGDPASPWVLAPPGVIAAMRRMQDAGEPLGAGAGPRVRRGIMTGANDVLVLRSVEPKLGGLARVEAEGWRRVRRAGGAGVAARRYRAWVETGAIRPLVRGSGIDAFRYRTDSYVVWCHDGAGAPAAPPPRLSRYLERHRSVLEARQGWRPGRPLGAIFRLASEGLGHRVAWHDLSDTVRAVALPPTHRFDGLDRELVALNTVYFLPVPDRREALLLAGLLNSLPVRVFLRAIAERAKDARFRFFAWTVSCLPLPGAWRGSAAAREILALSAAAHEAGGIAPESARRLDAAVAALYGLDSAGMAALASFDAWLRGKP
ncbi:MAG TPA: hypothetical protein VMM12_12070 [Longimicrobiales bacterium]|nr:hypothetical protein [Longimicrobiales bacterium]